MVHDLPYLKYPKLTGSIKNDVMNLLMQNGKRETAIHCAKVAKTCHDLAERFGHDKSIAYCAGILHDVANIVRPPDMLNYAEKNNWYIDDAERKHNFLLHQRISAVIAKEHFGVTDENILSAIECHSTLKAYASEYDMLLFLSDKISWDQQGIPPFLDVLQESLNVSLMAASIAYIKFAFENNMILFPHRWLSEAKGWLEQYF